MSVVAALDDDCIAWITVRMHAPGSVSVNGMIADKAFALKLLDHARDAIKRQKQIGGGVTTPSYDVSASPNQLLRPVGDIPIGERGDP